MTQPPVRYENYPPDDSATPDDHTPVIRPYVPDTIPPPPASGGDQPADRGRPGDRASGRGDHPQCRRQNGNSAGRMGGMEGDLPEAQYTEYTEEPVDPDSLDEQFSVGSHTATAPSGWIVHDDGSGTVEVTNGANKLTAVSFDTAPSTLAVDEIVHLAKSVTAWASAAGSPIRSTARPPISSTPPSTAKGKFKGKAARLMVELWVDDEGSGLLVVRVLTAKAASVISTEAQEMLEELSGDF